MLQYFFIWFLMIPQDFTNIPYLSDNNPKHCLDLYIPSQKPFKTVIFVHGGGWKYGDKSDYSYVGNFLQEQGIACAIINYRLTPEVTFPAHAEDVIHAVRWVENTVSFLGGNKEEIYICGHSAGAHLCAWSINNKKISCKKLILISGIYNIDFRVDLVGLKDVFIGYSRTEASLKKISREIPPAIIIYAENDLPTLNMDSQFLYRAWLKSGNEAALFRVIGKSHFSIIKDVQIISDRLNSEVSQ